LRVLDCYPKHIGTSCALPVNATADDFAICVPQQYTNMLRLNKCPHNHFIVANHYATKTIIPRLQSFIRVVGPAEVRVDRGGRLDAAAVAAVPTNPISGS